MQPPEQNCSSSPTDKLDGHGSTQSCRTFIIIMMSIKTPLSVFNIILISTVEWLGQLYPVYSLAIHINHACIKHSCAYITTNIT